MLHDRRARRELVTQRLQERDRRDHVHLEDPAQDGGVDVVQRGKRAGAERARVVHHQLHRAEAGGGRGDGVAVRGVGHVAGDGDDAPRIAPRAERVDRPVETVAAAGVDHERPALLGERLGQREAESLRRSGDHGDGRGSRVLGHGVSSLRVLLVLTDYNKV